MKNQAVLLDNSMFDDGSFECFNFWVADQDGCYQVDASSDVIQAVKVQIELRMSQGHAYMRCQGLVYGGVEILEIQWG